MTYAIASDHAGVALKEQVIQQLVEYGCTVQDYGPEAEDGSVDYADYAHMVCREIRDGFIDRGVLICGSGIGMSMAANKVSYIRAALVSEPLSARLAREHNAANVLCLGARMVGPEMVKTIVEVFHHSVFQGGRHERRVAKLHAPD